LRNPFLSDCPQQELSSILQPTQHFRFSAQ
jgi:hypothetical protein